MISVRTEGNPLAFVASIDGKDVGRLEVSIVPLVHDMTLEPGLVSRKVAEALFQYASGYVKASGFSEALMLVLNDNPRMQCWLEGIAGTLQNNVKAYTVELP